MTDLGAALARLDRTLNHEASSASGIAAGKIAGLSLEPMHELMTLLGDPHRSAPVVHITGTNGKGTVASMITELLVANGLSVGTYSSPHVDTINERLRRNGEPIDDEELALVLDSVMDLGDLARSSPSWFEVVTAAAFRWFAEVAVDVMVVEVGLLGRYDATNVVDAAVAVITNVGADHTDLAPGWETAVASEKAGIIRPDADVVLGAVSDEVRAVVDAEGPARVIAVGDGIEILDDRTAMGGHVVSFTTPWGQHDGMYVPLHGASQAENAAVATAAVESFFDRPLSDDVSELAMASVTAPGRCEVVAHQPLVVLDGAHNRDAAEHLVDTLTTEFSPVGSRMLVVGMLTGRTPSELLDALAPYGWDVVVATSAPSPRGLRARSLASEISASFGLEPEVIDNPREAVERLLVVAGDDDMVVVAGSFYLVSPARAAITAAS
ncbi:MAG TPA: Mur ligase family protein [Microthrixaceae bacterium]|nr:Mur ligase family protein [Microthrixaceae bacterium]